MIDALTGFKLRGKHGHVASFLLRTLDEGVYLVAVPAEELIEDEEVLDGPVLDCVLYCIETICGGAFFADAFH